MHEHQQRRIPNTIRNHGLFCDGGMWKNLQSDEAEAKKEPSTTVSAHQAHWSY